MSELLKSGRTRSKEEIYRDTRSFFSKAGSFLHGDGLVLVIGGSAMTTLLFPAAGLLSLSAATLLSSPFLMRKLQYPLFAPKSLEKYDYKNPPTGKKFGRSEARGISYLGLDELTNLPVYSTNDLDRQHNFKLATTGGGKSQFIAASDIAAGAMVQLSGFLLTDGKATIDLYYQIYGILRRVGREVDLLVLNFIKGERDFRIRSTSIPSHSFNPFFYGTASQISELLKSLLGSVGGEDGGKDDVWRKRAEDYIEGITRIFVYLRDVYDFKFSIQTYREFLDVGETIRLLYGWMEPGRRVEIPDDLKSSIATFLKTLAGLNKEVIEQIGENDNREGLGETAGEQFNYVSMQVSPVLNMLASDYGHIFGQNQPDIDLKDGVLNNRGTLVLLPSLEYSKTSLSNLGIIVITTVKSMMAMQLGTELEGDPKLLNEQKAYASPAPFRGIFDEVTYYLSDGLDLAAAQGRGLGMAFTFATQELGAAKAKNSAVTSAIWGSTNMKLIGKLEDSDASLSMIKSRISQVYFTSQSGYKIDDQSTTGGIYDSTDISIGKQDLLEMSDLAAQREGEQYLICGAMTIKLRAFYVDADDYTCPVTLNKFVGVNKPSEEEVSLLKNDSSEKIKNVMTSLLNDEVSPPGGKLPVTVKEALKKYADTLKAGASQKDSSIVSVWHYMETFYNTTSTGESAQELAMKQVSKFKTSNVDYDVDGLPDPEEIVRNQSNSSKKYFDKYGIEDMLKDDFRLTNDRAEGIEFDFDPDAPLEDDEEWEDIGELNDDDSLDVCHKSFDTIGEDLAGRLHNAGVSDLVTDTLIEGSFNHPTPPTPPQNPDNAKEKLANFMARLKNK